MQDADFREVAEDTAFDPGSVVVIRFDGGFDAAFAGELVEVDAFDLAAELFPNVVAVLVEEIKIDAAVAVPAIKEGEEDAFVVAEGTDDGFALGLVLELLDDAEGEVESVVGERVDLAVVAEVGRGKSVVPVLRGVAVAVGE